MKYICAVLTSLILHSVGIYILIYFININTQSFATRKYITISFEKYDKKNNSSNTNIVQKKPISNIKSNSQIIFDIPELPIAREATQIPSAVAEKNEEGDAAVNNFILSVADKIKKQFILSSNSKMDDNLVCVILLKLNNNGTIRELSIIKSSNNDQFDILAMNAIKSAAPFESLPEIAINEISTNGFELNFKL